MDKRDELFRLNIASPKDVQAVHDILGEEKFAVFYKIWESMVTSVPQYESNRTEYLVNGILHSVNDQPAVVFADGTKIWYRYGHIHRDNDLPAIERGNELHEWWQNNRRHRLKGPAVVKNRDGEGNELIQKEWYIHGERTRQNTTKTDASKKGCQIS